MTHSIILIESTILYNMVYSVIIAQRERERKKEREK